MLNAVAVTAGCAFDQPNTWLSLVASPVKANSAVAALSQLVISSNKFRSIDTPVASVVTGFAAADALGIAAFAAGKAAETPDAAGGATAACGNTTPEVDDDGPP